MWRSIRGGGQNSILVEPDIWIPKSLGSQFLKASKQLWRGFFFEKKLKKFSICKFPLKEICKAINNFGLENWRIFGKIPLLACLFGGAKSMRCKVYNNNLRDEAISALKWLKIIFEVWGYKAIFEKIYKRKSGKKNSCKNFVKRLESVFFYHIQWFFFYANKLI